MKRFSVGKTALFVGLFLLLCTPAWPAERLRVTVTSPWLTILVNFIGGVNVSVNSIQEWNDDGELVRRIRTRNLQTLPPDALVMAFDYRDSRGLGLPPEQYTNYRSLYNQMPLDEDNIDASMSDPSVMPFIAQRVLTILSDWDRSNYPYYQRRLAEFQARLYSTTLAGRQMLKDQTIYDLTGHSGAFLQAAGCKLLRPANEDLAAWREWKEVGQLTATVSRMADERTMTVIDNSTPKAIRSILNANPAVFFIARPRLDQDYPTFLHGQYLSLRSKITARPLPSAGRNR